LGIEPDATRVVEWQRVASTQVCPHRSIEFEGATGEWSVVAAVGEHVEDKIDSTRDLLRRGSSEHVTRLHEGLQKARNVRRDAIGCVCKSVRSAEVKPGIR